MARLPSVDDLQRVRVQSASNRPQARMGNSGEVIARAGRELQDTAGNIAADISRKRDDFDIAQAESILLRNSALSLDKLNNSQDFNSYEREYYSSMQKAREEAAKNIQDPRLRRLFRTKAEDTIFTGTLKARQQAREKETEFGKATLLNVLDQNQRTALEVPDEFTRNKVHQNTQAIIDGAVAKGYISPEQAFIQKRTYAENYATQMISMMPVEEQEKMLAPAEGEELRSVYSISNTAAAKHGVDGEALARIAMLESSGNPSAINPKSGAAGMFQFMPNTAKQYNLSNPTDAIESADAAARLMRDNANTLRKKLGRDPEPYELYLAHQQGAAGAAALLKDPERNAIEVMAKLYGSRERAERVVMWNGGKEDMTSGDFANLWQQRFMQAEVDDTPRIPYFKKTNSFVDMIPADKRIQLYSSAKQNKEAKREKQLQAMFEQIDATGEFSYTQLMTLDKKDQETVRDYYDTMMGHKAVTPEEEQAREVFYDTLARQVTENPKTIMNYQMSELRTKLNPDDFKQVQKWREAAADPIGLVTQADINQAIEYYVGPSGMNLNEKKDAELKRANEFRRSLNTRIMRFEKENGRKPNVDEVYAMGDKMIVQLNLEGGWTSFDKKIFGFEADEATDLSKVIIPDEFVNEVMDDWRKNYADPSNRLTEKERDEIIRVMNSIAEQSAQGEINQMQEAQYEALQNRLRLHELNARGRPNDDEIRKLYLMKSGVNK